MNASDAAQPSVLGPHVLGTALTSTLGASVTEAVRPFFPGSNLVGAAAAFQNYSDLGRRIVEVTQPFSSPGALGLMKGVRGLHRDIVSPVLGPSLIAESFAATAALRTPVVPRIPSITLDTARLLGTARVLPDSLISPTLHNITASLQASSSFASVFAQMDMGWKPLHDLVPGLTGGPIPGFDAAVRAVVRETSARYKMAIELPEEEIEFTDVPGLELDADLEFVMYVGDLSGDLRSAFIPREVLVRGLGVTVVMLCIAAVVQGHAPEILNELPPEAEQMLDAAWPDQAKLPGWLVEIIRLGIEIAGISTVSSWLSGWRRCE